MRAVNDKLYVRAGCAGFSAVTLVQRVLGILWKFRSFTSRWVTMGNSGRTIFVSQFSGLPALVSYIHGQLGTDLFHLNGYSRLQNPGVLVFMGLVALASRPSDAAVYLLL